ncbi:MAG TPA: DUF2227 family putative metal-binding protein [Anaerolineaceae bacterium]|nr:DUF2227 family putative metal-binding protein [Anaerolineaceae bacterium]HPN53006.1 DUF2227 family putative metal-binding protein [Anaerolineaceae bacterium]
MADGKLHAAVSVILAGSGQALQQIASVTSYQAMAFSLGALLGIILTPDLDLVGGSISQRQVRKSTGNIIGLIWAMLWYPYAKLLGHRSFWSHTPIIGTIIRIIYVFGLPLLLWSMLWQAGHVSVPPPIPVLGQLDPLLFWVLLGLSVSDLFHWLMDL